jgi:hypothetical protein
MNEGGNRTTAQQVVLGPLMNPNEIAQAFARDAGNLDPAPGQPPPRTSAAERKARGG